jgi:hypothetical protein
MADRVVNYQPLPISSAVISASVLASMERQQRRRAEARSISPLDFFFPIAGFISGAALLAVVFIP